MQVQTFAEGQQIITYGDAGIHYYILTKGNVKVIVYQKGASPADPNLHEKVLFTKPMGPGSGFGELALLYNDKRSATIQAVEESECYALDGVVFKAIIVKSSMQKRTK